jgi:hypothetical protein
MSGERAWVTATRLSPRSRATGRTPRTSRDRPAVIRPSSSRTTTAPGGDSRIVAARAAADATSAASSCVPVSPQRYRQAPASAPASAAVVEPPSRSQTQSCQRAHPWIAPASHSATYEPGAPVTTEKGASTIRWRSGLDNRVAVGTGRITLGRNTFPPRPHAPHQFNQHTFAKILKRRLRGRNPVVPKVTVQL